MVAKEEPRYSIATEYIKIPQNSPKTKKMSLKLQKTPELGLKPRKCLKIPRKP